MILERNKPIIKTESMRYFPDFLVNSNTIVEIKADCLKCYNLSREIIKIKLGLLHDLDYKLITNSELYNNKAIDNESLERIVLISGNFLGGKWNDIIKRP